MGGKLAVAAPPLFVAVVIGFVYGAFMTETMVPQYEFARGTARSEPLAGAMPLSTLWVVAITFHVLFAMLLLTFARSALTEPGYIPKTEYWQFNSFNIPAWKEERLMSIIADTSYTGEKLKLETAFLKSLPVVERKLKDKKNEKGTDKLRKCDECNQYKPDRTHHCKHCKRCILRMDHHCPWIANCVGFNNYKHFVLFLFYGWTTALFVVIFSFTRLLRAFRPITDTATFLKADVPVIVAFFVALGLFVALCWFFLVHIDYVVNCLTTIEEREKRGSDAHHVRHKWEVSHIKFDQGSGYANFLHVFGSPWMWLLPIQSDLAGTCGTYHEVVEMKADPADSKVRETKVTIAKSV